MDMNQSSQRIDAAASEWAVRLQLRVLSAEERAELDCWLEADSRHRGALLRASAAWLDVDRLAALAGHGGLSDAAGPSGVLEPPASDAQEPPVRGAQEPTVRGAQEPIARGGQEPIVRDAR